MYKLCAYIFVWLCVRVRVYAGIKMYRREVSNICLTKKENGRNGIIVEISPRHFKCNENVSERRKRGMKPDKI